jgi:glucuronoarabinoxylan endo-1,4-beta-xylanase
LVQGNVSAWHSWYMNPYPTTGNDGLTDGTNLTRRAWVIGNWSRFVRPGYLRVQATPSPQASVSVSAFSDPATGRLVVVLVNQKTRDLQQAISVGNGLAPASFAVWTTSEAVALENTGSPTISADGTFTVALPAQSVTTLVSDTL